MKKILFRFNCLSFLPLILMRKKVKCMLAAGLELALPMGDWSDAAALGLVELQDLNMAFTEKIVGMVQLVISLGGKDVGVAHTAIQQYLFCLVLNTISKMDFMVWLN